MSRLNSLVLCFILSGLIQMNAWAGEQPTRVASSESSSASSFVASDDPIVVMPAYAGVVELRGSNQVILRGLSNDFKVNQIYPLVRSFHSESNIKLQKKLIGYFRILSSTAREDGGYEYLAQSHELVGSDWPAVGDQMIFADYSSEISWLDGRTPLLRRGFSKTSARYKPLYTKGILLGDTAEVLDRNESLINFLGNYSMALGDRFDVNLVIPSLLLNSIVAGFKYQIYRSDNSEQFVSIEPSVAYSESADLGAGSLQILWDSVSNSHQITHTSLKLATFSFSRNHKDQTAFLLGSSLATGYEFVLNSWDRFLIGPTYNFDLKAVGGYASYLWIWDSYHFQLVLNTADISNFNWDVSHGYFVSFDMYWRY